MRSRGRVAVVEGRLRVGGCGKEKVEGGWLCCRECIGWMAVLEGGWWVAAVEGRGGWVAAV